MKWTPEQVKKLRELCNKGVPNADIANAIGCKVTDVHAKRSQLGITIPKVQATQKKPATKTVPGENPHMKVKVAFKALHTAIVNAIESGATTEGQKKIYTSTDALLATLLTLVFMAIES